MDTSLYADIFIAGKNTHPILMADIRHTGEK